MFKITETNPIIYGQYLIRKPVGSFFGSLVSLLQPERVGASDASHGYGNAERVRGNGGNGRCRQRGRRLARRQYLGGFARVPGFDRCGGKDYDPQHPDPWQRDE